MTLLLLFDFWKNVSFKYLHFHVLHQFVHGLTFFSPVFSPLQLVPHFPFLHFVIKDHYNVSSAEGM